MRPDSTEWDILGYPWANSNLLCSTIEKALKSLGFWGFSLLSKIGTEIPCPNEILTYPLAQRSLYGLRKQCLYAWLNVGVDIRRGGITGVSGPFLHVLHGRALR